MSEAALSTPLFSQARVQVGTVELPAAVFSEPLRRHLLYEAVCAYLAGARRGTASTKTKGEVRGGGRKPWRQKGTGRARVGSIRSPLWVGGGTVFGPKPRSYKINLPKQARRAALRSALATKFRAGFFMVLDRLALPEPKTKHMVEVMKTLQLGDGALVVLEGRDRVVELASRNLKAIKVVPVQALNVHDVLRYRHLVMTQEAVAEAARRLGR